MPTFHYKGYRTDGKDASGSINAESQREAVSRLKKEGDIPFGDHHGRLLCLREKRETVPKRGRPSGTLPDDPADGDPSRRIGSSL
jgi:hypothetical protein